MYIIHMLPLKAGVYNLIWSHAASDTVKLATLQAEREEAQKDYCKLVESIGHERQI